jgi:hypothetical protein
MQYRKLRIAFSAVCGVLCLLLIALWVRSYYRLDTAKAWSNNTVSSLRGRLYPNAKFSFTLDSGSVGVVEFFPGTSIQLGQSSSGLTSQASGTPIWSLLLLSTTVATLPWFRWRFSLRTLLIATTLVAILLALIASAAS